MMSSTRGAPAISMVLVAVACALRIITMMHGYPNLSFRCASAAAAAWAAAAAASAAAVSAAATVAFAAAAAAAAASSAAAVACSFLLSPFKWVQMRIPHKAIFVVGDIYRVSVAFPTEKHLIDVLTFQASPSKPYTLNPKH